MKQQSFECCVPMGDLCRLEQQSFGLHREMECVFPLGLRWEQECLRERHGR